MLYYEAVMGSKYKRNKFAKASQETLLGIDMFKTVDSEAYTSCFMYPDEVIEHLNKPPNKIRGYSGRITTDYLYWDFDSDDDITLAYNDVNELIDRLESEYDVSTDDIMVRYSGRKGFHVILPNSDVKELGARKDLNFIVKRVCLDIAAELGTCDESVYNKTGIIRVRNSKHPSTGRFCIPLEVEEFLGNSTDAIIEMAKVKKEWNVPLVPSTYPKIREKLRQACQTVRENPRSTGKFAYNDLVEGIMHGFKDGEGNTGLTSTAGYLHSCGVKPEVIYATLMASNSQWPKPMTPTKVMEIVQSVIRYPTKASQEQAATVQPAKKGRLLTMADGMIRWVEQKMNHEDIYTGFHNLNDMFYTFDYGKLCIIAGYSGLGKTNFGLQIARNICLSQEEKGTFTSLEMGIEALFFRASVIEESRDKDKVSVKKHTEALLEDIEKQKAVCDSWKCLYIADEAALSVEGIYEIQNEAEALAISEGTRAGLMIIDYAELIKDTDDEKKLAKAVKFIKDMSKSKKIRTILLAQFNRTGGDEYTEPFQNSIRGSAGIFNTADIVVGMWRDSKYDNRIHVKDMKNRDGERGTKFDLVQHGLAYDEEDYIEDKTEDVANAFYVPKNGG